MDTAVPPLPPPSSSPLTGAAWQNQEQYLSLLTQITNEAASILDFHQMLQSVTHNLRRLLAADGCYITTWDPLRQEIKPLAGSGPYEDSYAAMPPLPDKDTFTKAVLQQEHVIAVPDARTSPYHQVRIVTRLQVAGLLGIPLMALGQKMGALMLTFQEPHQFTAEEIQRAEQAATPIALAIAKARLLHQEQEQRALAEALREAGAIINETLDFDQLLDRILTQIARVVPYDSANIMSVEHGRARIIRHVGYEQTSPALLPIIPTLVFDVDTTANLRQMVQTRQPLIISDTTTYPGWAKPHGLFRAWVGVPIVVRNQVTALIALDKNEPDFYQPEHVARLSTFANQVALAWRNADLHKAAQRQLEEMFALQALTQAAAQAVSEDDLIEKATEIIGDTLYPHNFGVLLLAEQTSTLCPHASYRIRGRQLPFPPFPATQGIVGRVAQTGKPYRCPDVQQDSIYVNIDPETRSELCVPIFAGKHLIGVVNAESTRLDAFSEGDEHLLLTFARQLGVALEKLRLFAEIQQQSEEIRQWAHRLTLLQNLSHQLAGLVNIREVSHTCAAYLVQNFGFLSVSVHRVDVEAQEVVCEAMVGPNPELIRPGIYRQKFGQGLIGLVAQTGTPLVVNDTAVHSHFVPSPRISVCSELVLPLRRGDQLIGVLNVDSTHKNAFTDTDVTILTIAGDQLTAALERAHLFAQISQRAARFEALSTLSAELRVAENLEEMLPAILQRAMSVVGGSLGSLYLKDSSADVMVARGVYPPKPEMIGRQFHLGEGIIGHIAATGEIHITENMSQSSQARFYDQEKRMVEQQVIRSGIGLPLRAQERIIGVMYISLPEVHTFTAEEVDFLVAISEAAGGALDRMLVLQTLEERVAKRTHELEAANEKLLELDRLKSRFISEVSHELRTPITNLSLYLDLLTQSKPERQAYYMNVLRRQTDRLSQLIEDILSLSRLELGRDKIRLQPIDLNEVVRTAVSNLSPRIAEAGLTLTQKLHPDLPSIYGESIQLSLAVSHLLNNAIQFTPAGSIVARTGLDEAGTAIYLQVMDTGEGINAADLRHLFDRFYRGQQATQSNIPGTGLGLAIVKEVVDLHGGDIEVKSVEGEGSTFTVWLPVAGNR
ncbi:MAG: GAF domain-containing protein [Anaerolineae bacterium]|nr:GAF domain-containing protein [Anaerolineae bacterium]